MRRGDPGVHEREPTRLEVGNAHGDARSSAGRQDVVHRTGGDEATASEDRDPIGDLLHLREDVARDEHGPALGAEAPQEVAHLDDPGGIEAVGGLVEDQQRGILEQRRGDAEALLHPQRVGPDHVVRAGREARRDRAPHRRHRERCRRSSPGSRRFRLPVNRGNSAGASTIDPTRRITPASPSRDVVAEETGPSGRGGDEPEDAPDRRRLAGSVGPEEPEDPALGDLEVQPVESDGRRFRRNRRYSLRSPSISITGAIAPDRTPSSRAGHGTPPELLPSGGQPARGGERYRWTRTTRSCSSRSRSARRRSGTASTRCPIAPDSAPRSPGRRRPTAA